MNLRPRLIATAVAALCCLVVPASAAARSLVVSDADIDMKLGPDTALLVDERLAIDYEGHWQATYRDILLKKGEVITDVTVTEDGKWFRPGGCTVEGCIDTAGTFGVTSVPGGVRIVWHVNATDESRDFVVSYRVEDAVVAYDDVLDLEWQVWGDQWDFDLDSLTATLTDPSLAAGEATREKPSGVWGKPREVEGRDFLEAGVARLEAENIRSNQFVEMRVILPREPGENVNAARVEPGDGLEKILGEEEELDDDYNSVFNRTKRFIADNAVLLAIILAGLALAILFWLARLATEHRTSIPEHLPEPPDDASPALAYGLAHEGEDSADTVLATLLDLVDRGYYEATQATTDDEKLDLALAKAAKRPSAELEPHENEVLSFFDELIGSETVPMSDMKEKIPEHSAAWRGKWEAMTSKLNSIDEGQLQWDRDYNGRRWLLVLGLIAAFAVIVLCDWNVDREWFVPAAFGAVTVLAVIAYPSTRLKRLAPAYGERSAKWRAFERWTRDFPTLKDDPPVTLDLWKRILVFGVAFGTAKRMIESGRIPEPVMESSGAGWSGYYFHGGVTDTAFSGSSFSSGFASQVAPESSSGGGGGFSGGGGGASGGGGGGGW